MDRIQELTEAYQHADEEQRLYLFLSHPRLREAFMHIDLASRRTAAPAQQRTGSLAALLGRYLPACCLRIKPQV